MKFCWLIIFSCLITGCIKPFDITSEKFDDILVIEGLLTNSPGPQEVKISFARAFASQEKRPVAGATVWVEDSNGNEVNYQADPMNNGSYLSPVNFSALENESYQLFVEYAGSNYQSTMTALVPAPAIDSIYGRYIKAKEETINEVIPGIQFMVDSRNESGNGKYFRYEWEDTYLVAVPFPTTIEGEGGDSIMVPYAGDSVLVVLDSTADSCYTFSQSSSLILGTTQNSTQDLILEFPVRFVSERSLALRVAYSILVRQYAISQDAYLYYRALNKNNSGGTLFDEQPGTIVGNISSTDPDEIVLGFFEVSGVSQKRRQFLRRELDDRLADPYYAAVCRVSDGFIVTPDSVDYYKDMYRDLELNVYAFIEQPAPPPLFLDLLIGLHTGYCTDCTSYSSTTETPDYWEK